MIYYHHFFGLFLYSLAKIENFLKEWNSKYLPLLKLIFSSVTIIIIHHQCIMSSRRCLKTYSILFGFLISFLAFLWVAFQVYLISEISSNQHDLRMARYLDICFGFLAFFSAAALMYGAFVESKTWMSAWILGSIIVLLGRWLWYLKGKFSQVNIYLYYSYLCGLFRLYLFENCSQSIFEFSITFI